MSGGADSYIVTRPGPDGEPRELLFIHRFPYRTRATVTLLAAFTFLSGQAAIFFVAYHICAAHDESLLFPLLVLTLAVALLSVALAYLANGPSYFGPVPRTYVREQHQGKVNTVKNVNVKVNR
jgi:hypothetical protein